MSDPKDQPQTSPAQDSISSEPKKSDSADIMSINSSYDEFLFPTNKEMKLDQLQKLAYNNVLRAFKAESPVVSSPRILATKDLMKEWKITYQTHTAIEDLIRTDPLVKQLSNFQLASDEKEKQTVTEVEGISLAKQKVTEVEGIPLAKQKVTEVEGIPLAKPSSTPDVSSFKSRQNAGVEGIPLATSWGQVSPESLVGKRVGIRLLGEDTHIPFLIKAYDAETDLHHLVTAYSSEDFEDPCDWIDIRQIPAEDMIWEEDPPGLPTWKCSVKPGETIFYATSTTQQKKQT